MVCPYLEGSKKSKLCKISISKMAPSPDVMRTACIVGEYDSCPIFLAHLLRGCSRVRLEKHGRMHHAA